MSKLSLEFSNKSSFVMGLAIGATIALFILKLAGITISWLAVFAPSMMYCALVILCVILAICTALKGGKK